MARRRGGGVKRVESVYPSIAEANKGGIHPIINDDDINPHVDNTEAMLRKEEKRKAKRKSKRENNTRPGIFEPSGPNTHYRPHADDTLADSGFGYGE